MNGATYTTECSSGTTNSTKCVPSFYARSDSTEISTLTSTDYNANYSFSKPAYFAEGDMTYEYASGGNETGTTIYPDGTQITKITYTMTYAGYDVNVTYDNSTGTNYNQDFNHVQAAFQKTVVYFLVRANDTVFRVSGMPSSDQVTAGDYFTQFKILSSSQGTKGFCNDNTAATNLDWTSNDLTKALGTATYNTLLSATGWNSTGGQILNGPASCYAGTSTYTTRRTPSRTTSDMVCRNNNVSVEVAHAACVGALQGLEQDTKNQMLASCVYDWCSFGALGDVVESYIIQATMFQKLDAGFLTKFPVAQPVEHNKQKMIQYFIMAERPTWNDITQEVWEFAYGGLVNVTVTVSVLGDMGVLEYHSYKTDCRVWIKYIVGDRRDSSTTITVETSIAQDVPVTGLDTATGAALMAAAVNKVKASNLAYAGVASMSASNFQSVGQAYTYTGTFAGGSFAPTAAPEDHDSELDEYLIIVGVVGAVVLIAIILLIVVKMSARPTPAKADVETGQVGVTSVPLEPTPKEGN